VGTSRLTPAGRRAQLLAVGARAFAEQPFEQVRMDELAERAGVSRALLYQHFASKRELFAEVYRSAADGLLERSVIDPGLPLAEQVLAGLDAHLDYFAANRNAVIAANRDLAGDPTIQAIISDELAELRRRLLDGAGLTGPTRATVSSLVAAWLVFVRIACVDWLADGTCTRDELRDACAGALFGALGPFVEIRTG
jgi:AcrR family transcriptional regulator